MGGLAAALLASMGVLPGAATAAAVPATALASTTSAAEAPSTAESQNAALTKAAALGQKVEITSLRDETTETFATPDGHLEAVQHLRPVRTRSAGGWKDIDNTLVKQADGSITPKAAAVGMTLSGGGGTPLIQLSQAGRSLAYTWPKELPTPTLDGDTALYEDVLPDVDLRVRADIDSFTELLVVNTPEAAKNPGLAQLRLGVTADGLAVKQSADGGLQALDATGGGVAFAAPKPVMWDSGTVASAAVARRAVTDEPAASGTADDPAKGPTDASQVAPIGLDVSSDGSQLTLTPDQSLLTSSDTHFPVFIDPQTTTPKANDWTMVSKYWASSPQYHFNGDSDAGMGYCGWNYCAPYDTKRLFYKFSTAKFAGKTILDATFVAHETYSASCSARSVELWRANGFTSGTTWNSSADHWQSKLDTQSVAKGYGSSCAAGDVEFDAMTGVKYAASHNSADTTFGLRATNEGDNYGWKRFSDDAYLRVHYNTPPPQLKMSQLTMNPGGSCHKPESKVSVNTRPTLMASDVTDPDGDYTSVRFQAYWDANDGKGVVAHWTSAWSTAKKSGSDFSVPLTDPLPGSSLHLPTNQTLVWAAQSRDYDQGTYYSSSPWSQTGSATGCYFVYDTTAPSAPKVVSGDYPAVDDADPSDPTYDGVGRYGTFTAGPAATNVVKYCWGMNADPVCDSTHTVTTTSGAARPIQYRPTRAGTNFLYVQAVSSASTASAPATYQFRVKQGQPAQAQWQMDDRAGATSAAGSAGDRTLAVHGSPTFGVAGKVGSAIGFNGTDDYLASDIPTVHTDTGFSVAAWVKLDTVPAAGNPAPVAVTQPGNYAAGFELYYSTSSQRWVFDQYTADTAAATPVRAIQADTETGKTTAGTWYHLAGTYSSATDLLSLYVNGSLAGTATFANAWDARRGLQIGAGSHSGVAANFFPGTVDDVRIFDKPLTAADVTNVKNQAQLGVGRLSRAVFPLDETATDTNGNATAEVHGAALVDNATFHGTVTAGAPGAQNSAATFDGTSGYAATRSPHVNNQAGYSVIAWAKLSSKPTHAGIIATQTSASRPGFELYYSASYGWTFNNYVTDTTGSSAVRATQGDTTHSPAGEWTQLVGTYDAVANQLSLYVNGEHVQSTSFSAPFYAGGPVQIGAGNYDGAPSSFFPGQIDDVRLYDRALSAEEAAALYQTHTAVEGRWKLDGATGTPAVSPDDVPNAADQHPLTLGAGASIDAISQWVGSGAMALSGTTTGYAATSTSPVDTGHSFTVGTWVTTAAVPQQPATVMSMAGANTNGFQVRYVPDSPPTGETLSVNGRWQLVMPGSDSTTATKVLAESPAILTPGEWQQLSVVYDAPAGQMRLYVNGEQLSLPCEMDASGDKVDPACTDVVPFNWAPVPFTATKGLQLGRAKTSATAWGEYWPGEIDDVWALQGAASDNQIADLRSGIDLDTVPGP